MTAHIHDGFPQRFDMRPGPAQRGVAGNTAFNIDAGLNPLVLPEPGNFLTSWLAS